MADLAPHYPQAEAVSLYAPSMEFRVLGPVEVYREGDRLAIGGPKQRSVLALLIAHAGRPVSLDRLVDEVYGADAPAGARHSVQTYISSFRRELGDVIQRAPAGYLLAVDANEIDSVQFEDAVRRALAHVDSDSESAASILRDALALWHGHAFADVEGWGSLAPEITRLHELRLTALEARIDADLNLGRHKGLLGELDALTTENPLRERFRAQQMLALYRSGRQTEALRAYEHTRTYLGDEIGIEPSPELQALEQQILQQDPAIDMPSAPTLAERAVLVIEVANRADLIAAGPSQRSELMQSATTAFGAAVSRHGGENTVQRGSALYASFGDVGTAVEALEEVMAAEPRALRAALDYGDVELHESGDILGPPTKRTAGMVAAAHPGQVLLSSAAHNALISDGPSGWTVRSLGLHPLQGMSEPQQVFELVLPGQNGVFPPLRIDALPPAQPMDRGSVAGYELRRPVASDLAGTKYRAYQPSVGREVLVTAIDAAWANSPEFVVRFEVETQMVGRLHHPHIVPLLDFWRDPTGAYLVTPLVGSNSLDRAMGANALDRDARRRVVMEIGSALSYAHSLGVVHGALTPATIALDDSGNAYITADGFVIRQTGAPRVASRYSPPEAAVHEPVTAAADIFSLGAITNELFDDAEGVSDLVARSCADDPADRFSTIDEFLASFSHLVDRSRSIDSITPARNPYKGLDAFGEADAGDFFGRADDVSRLIEGLTKQRLIVVVGPSGSGKSSLVKAGLVPAIRNGAIDGRWVVTDMFPGSYPFLELESALNRVAVTDTGDVSDEIRRDEQGLLRVVKRVLPQGTRLLLVIDQFEELFTLTRDPETRHRFLDALTTLAADRRSDARIVVTMRADFFDKPLQYQEFGELFRAGTYPLTALSPDQLSDAIRRPAEAVGVEWEEGLVDQIVQEVTEAPGALPLLQYALTDLFSSRTADRLGYDDYHTIGGVVGALGSRAEEVFQGLSKPARSVARDVFLRLVTVQLPSGHTRRRARLIELNSIAQPSHVAEVLRSFDDARLITFDRDPVTRGPTVEVAHEALLARWRELEHWITEAEEELLLRQRLDDLTEEWERHERDPAYLLSGARLAQFRSSAADSDLKPSAPQMVFLELSTTRADEQKRSRVRRRRLIMGGFAAAAVVAVVLGVLALIGRQQADANARLAHSRELAASAINTLDEDPELSLMLAIAAADESEPSVATVSALHESLAAQRKAFTYTWPSSAELRQDLLAELSPDGRFLLASAGGTYVELVEIESGETLWSRDFGGDGITRAAFNEDGSEVVVTYGWASRQPGDTMTQATSKALGIHVLDAATGQTSRHLPFDGCGLVVRSDAIKAVGTGSNKYLVAEVSDDLTCSVDGARVETYNPSDPAWPPASLIDLSTGEIRALSELRPDPDAPPSAGMSADGRFVFAAGYDPEADRLFARVIETSTEREIARVAGWPMGMSADGSVGLTYLPDTRTRLTWDFSDGQPDAPMTDSVGTGLLWLSRDGRFVAEGEGSLVLFWDPRTGEPIDELLTGLASHASLFFSSDGSRVVITEALGGKAAVFDLPPPSELGSTSLCAGLFKGAIEVADNTTALRAVCPDSDGATQYLIDSNTSLVKATVTQSGGDRSALSPDGRLLADQYTDGQGEYGPITLRDADTGLVKSTLPGMCTHVDAAGPGCKEFPETPFANYARDLSFSPDGSMLAMASDHGDGVPVWDTTTGELTAIVTVEHDSIGPNRNLDVGFSPDGRLLAASFVPAPFELWLFSTDDWTPLAQYGDNSAGEEGPPPTANLTFTPDGKFLIATDFQDRGTGRIVVMDAETLALVGEISNAHDGGVSQLAVDPSGTLVASAGWDGFVRVWDIATRTLVQEIPVTSDGSMVGGVAFTEEGHILATDNQAGLLRLYAIDTDELLEIARHRVTRSFTDVECATYRIESCSSSATAAD